MIQSARSTYRSFQIPAPDSEEMKTIQTVLEVLSIYWKPLRRLVRLATIVHPKQAKFFPFLSTHVPEANQDQAVKLNKVLDAGQSDDADLITSPTYPWTINHPGRSLDDDSNPLGTPDKSSPNGRLLQSSYGRLLSERQPVQDVDRHEDGTESRQALAAPQAPSPARVATENPVSQAPGDFGEHFAPFEGFLANSSEGVSDFDGRWWNAAPAIDVWENPLSLNEMSSMDAMP